MESYAAGETTPPLIEETIGANLERTVAAYADREALVEAASGRRWTWAELNRDVDAFARGLLGAGIAKGDRVGIWAPNCAEWVIVQFATAKVGAILVNVNPSYRTHEFSYAVNQSGLRLLIAATSFKTSDYRGMVEETREQCRGLQRVVYLDTDDWAALVAEGEGVSEEALRERMASLEAGEPINIQYTSGTTGYPKGATLSHRNILNNGFFTTELINFTAEDRLCIPVPFYHCFGMVMGNLGCSTHGATMVIPSPGFDPATTLRVVAEDEIAAEDETAAEDEAGAQDETVDEDETSGTDESETDEPRQQQDDDGQPVGQHGTVRRESRIADKLQTIAHRGQSGFAAGRRGPAHRAWRPPRHRPSPAPGRSASSQDNP